MVEASAIEVKVLGTAFNVQEDSIAQTTTVDVKEGRVEVSLTDGEQKEVLMAGDRAIINWQNLTISRDFIPAPSIFNWQMDELDFDKKPLKEVVDLLGQVFETKIELANPGFGDTLWSIDLRRTTLEEALIQLEGVHEMPVHKDSGYYRVEAPK